MAFRTWSWHPASAPGNFGIGRVPGTERVSVNIFSICYGGVRTKIIVRGPRESDEGWALSAHTQNIYNTLLATDVPPSPEKVRNLVPSWQLKKLRPREVSRHSDPGILNPEHIFLTPLLQKSLYLERR